MPSPSRPARRHARRSSGQGRAIAPSPDPQTPTARRRNLYRPPASVVTRHAQVRHWDAELRDLTQNLAEIQQRIQQLETLQHPRRLSQRVSEDSVRPGSRPRAPSNPYRLPELGLDANVDGFHLPLDDWLHASPPRAPTSSAIPLSPVADADEQSGPLDAPRSGASKRSARTHRTGHRRNESAFTMKSFDSYNTEAVQVYEASTAAIVRPCIRKIAPAQAVGSPIFIQHDSGSAYERHFTGEDKENQPPTPLMPPPLFAAQKAGLPRQASLPLQPRSSSLPSHDVRRSRHSQSSSWLAHGGSRMEGSACRPLSGATVIQRSRQASPSPTPSDGWVTESIASDDGPGSTFLTVESPQPSFSEVGTAEESRSLDSFQPERWQQSSPPPAEEPRLDSSCTSLSDPPTPTASLPKTSARLNLFPKIQQSSYESLGRQCDSTYDKDPFYSVCPDQTDYTEWTSALHPTPSCEVSGTTDMPNAGDCSAQEPSSPLGRPRRKDHRLREILTPGVKRQTRDMSSSHLVRSPRKKLRTFLRRFTPNMGKTRHSMPASAMPPAHSSMSLERRFRTPPRLPTRQGSTLPFDEALLGELTRISDRGNMTSRNTAPSPARRNRNSMRDAAGLTLSRTAATQAHWRAQRSRSSIFSLSVHARSRAPTSSTFGCSLSSGPSFHFLPEVDRLPVAPVRRGPPVGRHRKSRY